MSLCLKYSVECNKKYPNVTGKKKRGKQNKKEKKKKKDIYREKKLTYT